MRRIGLPLTLPKHKELFIHTATLPAELTPAVQRPQRLAFWGHCWPLLKTVPFFSLHLACLAVFFVPITSGAVLLCAAFYFVRMFGITAGYHRYFAHRSYKTSRVFQWLLAWIGCSAMQKGPLWWSAHHRQHHRYSDKPEDPHSPLTTNFLWSHIGWVLSSAYDPTNFAVVRDWRRFPELRWLNSLHWIPGVLLAVLCFMIGDWSGLVWGFFVSTILVYHATFTVNSLCHLFGDRRYKTSDASRNNWFVALITLGEGWHNNHHHCQTAARQGFFWWEIDISYYLIRLLGLVGLVWDIRKPSAAKLAG